MGTQRTRTALYSVAKRHDLGNAVAAAREYAGWPTTAEFARALGRSPRAVYALEAGEPTVGQSILHAVGLALGQRLDGWDQDTPRVILDGGPVPPLRRRGDSSAEEQPSVVDETEEWTDEDETFYQALSAMLRPHGLKPTPEIVAQMRHEWEDQQRSEQDYTRGDSAGEVS